jgi:hypothetical protein
MWDCRVSGFRDFSYRMFLVTENPEVPNPDARVTSSFHVVAPFRSIGDREIVIPIAAIPL